jgi:hypothetical protein
MFTVELSIDDVRELFFALSLAENNARQALEKGWWDEEEFEGTMARILSLEARIPPPLPI